MDKIGRKAWATGPCAFFCFNFALVLPSELKNVSKMKDYRKFIRIDPSIRFGKPCIVGTRITVGDVLGWLASGMSFQEIIEDFPELNLEKIRAALAFAAARETNTKLVAA